MAKFLLIDNGSLHTMELAKLLPTTPTILRFGDIKTHDFVGYDCIILSGSSQLPVIGNEDIFKRELALIHDAHTPIIGVCLGAELIGHAFGAVLHDLGERRKGLIDIISTDANEVLLEAGRHFSVYDAHRWALKTIPNDFEVLAQSDHGPEIIKHTARHLWGLQFHPEHLTDSTLGDEIFSRILIHSIPQK